MCVSNTTQYPPNTRMLLQVYTENKKLNPKVSSFECQNAFGNPVPGSRGGVGTSEGLRKVSRTDLNNFWPKSLNVPFPASFCIYSDRSNFLVN